MAGAYTLGRPPLGPAFPDGAGTLGTLLSATRRPHKKLTDWTRQMVLQLRRWLPNRPLVLVGDSGYAVLNLLHFCQSLHDPVAFITRLRLDAALYAPAPPRQPGRMGRPG